MLQHTPYAPGSGTALPDGTVYLHRPHPYVGEHFCGGHDGLTAAERVTQFAAWLQSSPSIVNGIREDYPNFAFACTCPAGVPCIADVLTIVADGLAPEAALPTLENR